MLVLAQAAITKPQSGLTTEINFLAVLAVASLRSGCQNG